MTTQDYEVRKYRVGLDLHTYYRNLIIACLITLIIGVGATIGIIAANFYDHDAALKVDFDREMTAMYQREQDEKAKLREEISKAEHDNDDELAEAAQREADLQEQYDELNARYEEVMAISEADYKLLKRYWYVLKQPSIGVTLDCIRYNDQKCKEWRINPDWMWAIYWKESNFQITALNKSSGARGLGQVPPSTGKSYWEKILGYGPGSFRVEMLDDPIVNIAITTAHIGRDLDSGSTPREAINHYSGGGGFAYWNDVVRIGKEFGLTLTEENLRIN